MNDFTKEQMLAAYRNVPEPIRDSFDNQKNNDVIARLGKTYQLHVDTMGTINRETSYLLLGLTNPIQYAERLRSKVGLSETIATGIIREVNEQIFKPLQEEMRMASQQSPAPTAPVQTQVIQTQVRPAQLPRPIPPPPANLPGMMPEKKLLSDHEVPHMTVPHSSYGPVDNHTEMLRQVVGDLGSVIARIAPQAIVRPTTQNAPRITERAPLPINRPIPPPIQTPAPIESRSAYPADPYREIPE